MIVNDPQIRHAFDRIGFVSLGQSPNILELQRALFSQLTATELSATEYTTAESQFEQMQIACSGRRYLLVLDGI